jgi:hypothetical protein
LLDAAAQRAAGERPSSPIRAGLGLALAVVVLLAPLAYAAPDGLQRVAQSLGFQGKQRAGLSVPLSNYGVPGLGSGVLTTIVAGSIGTLLLFGLCFLLARVLVPRARAVAEPDASSAPVTVESSA